MIKESTSSTFVFAQIDGEWNLGLIYHPRLLQWMLAGGHVEPDEHAADAAVREVLEETGLQIRLLTPRPILELPPSYPIPEVPSPWWINELPVPSDGHTREPHIHVDHQFLAVAPSPRPVSTPEHPFRWCRQVELDQLNVVGDTRMLAHQLLPTVDDVMTLCRN